jgi:hypothetical protein
VAHLALATALLILGAATTAPSRAAGQQTEMGPPPAGPAHEVLKMEAGTWDAIVEATPAPGAQSVTSKGVETSTIGCGGKCLITDYKGEFMPGQSFEGHGTTTYDVSKQKYVGSWTDSMSQGLMVSEATWDAASRTMTGYMEGPDMSGNISKMKSVVEYKDDNTRVFTMYGPGPDGKEAMGMRITYKRRN